MTIKDAIARLKGEMGHNARFHCRAILVSTVGEYVKLLAALRKLGDDVKFVDIDTLFSAPDLLPDYSRLKGKEFDERWLILPGVGEYLRVFRQSELDSRRFAGLWRHAWDANTTGRILIPLWGSKTLWYDGELQLSGDERRADDFLDCTREDADIPPLRIQLLPENFRPVLARLGVPEAQTFSGVRAWYSYWYHPQAGVRTQLLLTQRSGRVRNADGEVRVQVIRNTLDFLRGSLTNGGVLNEKNCPEEAQACLFGVAHSGLSVEDAILKVFNRLAFEPLDIMNGWSSMSPGERQLIFLWYALHPDESYLCFCVERCREHGAGAEGLGKQVLMSVFDVRLNRPEWVEASQALISAMRLERDDVYFSALEAVPDYGERLALLSGRSERERSYILNLVGRWLHTDPEGALGEPRIAELYPGFAAYLHGDYPDPAAQNYFLAYKIYKLSNTLPSDERAFLSGIRADDYELRYPVLSELADGDTFALWIDALGGEWLPLLRRTLSEQCDADIAAVRLVRAQLPTLTRFNEQWKQMNLPWAKLDGLDKLAHHGVVDDRDYYACVERQLGFFAEKLVPKVNALLQEHASVIITGDHGTSRLAARCFHLREGLDVPVGADVGSHGRYCSLPASSTASPLPAQKLASGPDGTKYLAFANYDHYKQQGFATGVSDSEVSYGEIHGGATPEERLVPVILLRSRRDIPLSAQWNMASVKIKKKRAECRISFSKPVTAVQASIGEYKAECSAASLPSKEWTLSFRDLRINAPQRFNVTLVADGMLVAVDDIEIKPALGGNDPF